ncbi:MAG: preprotein translocase subunit SecE [Clostridia bacterium]|nr:preprotein translocase subunit SecE [Clostridia bacterium]MBQ6704238.1 preprotein translocase subunit SecE [Clostridia bacterium]
MANETNVKKNRVSMKQFFKEVSGEVKKLAWPTKKELISYTLTVLGFIILMAIIIYALDLVFGEGLGLLARL